MTTVPPPTIKEFDTATVEKTAYNSVKDIPTKEPNDQNRLGYSIWVFLTEKKGTLEQAVHNAGSRILIPETEAIQIIQRELKKSGMEL